MRKSFRISLVVFACVAMTSVWALKTKLPEVKSGYLPHSDMSGEHISAQCQAQLEKAKKLKDELLAPHHESFNKVLIIYNNILIALNGIANKSGLLAQVHPDEKIRVEAKKCEQEVSSFNTSLSLDPKVYKVFKEGLNVQLDQDAKRFLKHILRDFDRSGVTKDDKTRLKIKELSDELVTISQEFMQNIRNDRLVLSLDDEKDLAGLPADFIASHKKNEQGKIEISTDAPDYIPFMKYAKNKKLREQLYNLYLNRGKNNDPLLKKMLQKRYEIAKLLGYKSFAEYAAADKMIKNSSAIHEFIDKIALMAKESADKEYRSLLEQKKRDEADATQVLGYESAYWIEEYKKTHLNFDSQIARTYFPFQAVLDGLLTITSELFDISFKRVMDAKVWHESVLTYDVFDSSGKLGRIYLDMHPRTGKYEHAAQFAVRNGVKGVQYPEAALICNLPDPKMSNGVALLDHAQVITMFHEFGHVLHHIFSGKQDWLGFSGLAMEWDFIEAPALLLEEWAWSESILKRFARHYKTNEAISADLVKRMRAANDFGRALTARQQAFYSGFSVEFHDKNPNAFEPLEVLKKNQEKYSYIPYQEGTYFHRSFGHIVSYSALYYTYIWSLVIAKDLFEPFKQHGLMNKEYANRFKKTILEQGGRKDAKDLVIDFLGRPFDFKAYQNWLTKDQP